LPVIGTTLPLALGGLFFIFFAFEFTIVSSFGLTTEILPGARATMMAGFYAAAGLGRMAGALIGGVLWLGPGLQAVVLLSATATVLGLLSLLWGLSRWSAKGGDCCDA
jgi:DHA1 family inner membrane transport protein